VRRLLALTFLAVSLSACGSPGPAPKAEYDAVAEAMKAFDRSDWALAARLLREAIVKQPTDGRLHYSLAVSVAHLELRDEAIREFRWVVAHTPSQSPEHQAARNWLIAAGVLIADRSAGEQSPDGSDSAGLDVGQGSSTVRGQVSWNDGEPPVKLTRLQVFLKGIDQTPTKDVHVVARTDEAGRFVFRNVPAGTYKVTNRIAGEPLWRVRVSVEPGQEASIDLTPQNSLRARDDFPQDGK
jgi:hypothetical protein